MKVYKEKSGLYHRGINPNTGNWDNICFEELTRDERESYMKDKDVEWLKDIFFRLIETLDNTFLEPTTREEFEINFKEEYFNQTHEYIIDSLKNCIQTICGYELFREK